MFVYPPGGRFSGLPGLVQPGGELFGETSQESDVFPYSGMTDSEFAVNIADNIVNQETLCGGCSFNAPLKRGQFGSQKIFTRHFEEGEMGEENVQ